MFIKDIEDESGFCSYGMKGDEVEFNFKTLWISSEGFGFRIHVTLDF